MTNEDQTFPLSPTSETPEAKLIVDLPISGYLNETAKWAKFLAIVGFIFTGLMVVCGLSVMLFGSFIPKNDALPFNFGIFGFIYVLMALLYFFPTRYLYRFASQTQLAIRNSGQEALTEAFLNLKSVFKFMGIVTICIFGFYILMMVGFMLVALIAKS